MSEKLLDSNSENPDRHALALWTQVLDTVAEQVGSAVFETWFRPVALAGWDEESCEIVVPNSSFQRRFLDNYGDVLKRAIGRLVDAPPQLRVSTQTETNPDEPPILPVVHASALVGETTPKPWLIEQLWMREAVGMIGGPPKLLKTWLVLEMAVSVATRSACLGRFPVHTSGPVLLFAAEDSQPKVRSRLQSLARNHGFGLEQIDIQVITADTLRLDRADDQERLAATVMRYKPVLLVLDPLVRLHGLDENQSGPMAALLGYFRALQRRAGTAIAIVHHSRKNISSNAAAGYSLRGSGDLYAWVDSFISVQRRRSHINLMAEHRSAPGLGPLPIELSPLSSPEQVPYLRLVSNPPDEIPEYDPLPARIVDLLDSSAAPLTTDSIRSNLRVRKQRVVDALHRMCEEGRIAHDANRYSPRKSKS